MISHCYNKNNFYLLGFMYYVYIKIYICMYYVEFYIHTYMSIFTLFCRNRIGLNAEAKLKRQFVHALLCKCSKLILLYMAQSFWIQLLSETCWIWIPWILFSHINYIIWSIEIKLVIDWFSWWSNTELISMMTYLEHFLDDSMSSQTYFILL